MIPPSMGQQIETLDRFVLECGYPDRVELSPQGGTLFYRAITAPAWVDKATQLEAFIGSVPVVSDHWGVVASWTTGNCHLNVHLTGGFATLDEPEVRDYLTHSRAWR